MTSIREKPDKFLPLSRLRKRHFNYKYHLLDEKGTAHQVCQRFLIGVLQVKPNRLYRAIQSSGSNPSGMEKRVRAPAANKTSVEAKQGVKDFINRFPSYESHYGRAKSKKKYLNPNLDVRKMYKMYEEVCTTNEEKPVSEHIFRHIFNTEFNLSFKTRHTDTCSKCDSYNIILKDTSVSEADRAETKNQQDAHHRQLGRIKAEWEEDVRNAQSDETMAILTFDLQKALETPSLSTNVAYYKRQLWTYNLCIYNEVEKRGIYDLTWNQIHIPHSIIVNFLVNISSK